MSSVMYYARTKQDAQIKSTLDEVIDLYEAYELDDTSFVWVPGDAAWTTLKEKFILLKLIDDDVVDSANNQLGNHGDKENISTKSGSNNGDSRPATPLNLSSSSMASNSAEENRDNRNQVINLLTNADQNNSNFSEVDSYLLSLDQYYITNDEGKTNYGPFSLEQLKMMFKESRMNKETLVLKNGGSVFTPLNETDISYLIIPEEDTSGGLSQPSIIDDNLVFDSLGGYYYDEKIMLKEMFKRFCHLQPYTYLGCNLVSINPLINESLPILDVSEFIDQPLTRADGKGKRQPHPYSMAEHAYQMLCFTQQSQNIVLLGTSGSGKTENLKTLITYLAHRQVRQDNGDTQEDSILEKSIKAAVIIFESFCHAKTSNNFNSSRVGFRTKLLYSLDIEPVSHSYRWSSAKLSGVVFDLFMLEHNRVTSNMNESVFHVFNELIAANSRVSNNKFNSTALKLGAAIEHIILHAEGPANSNDAADTINFEYLYSALEVIGLSKEEINEIFSIVASIIHLGNVTFKPVVATSGWFGKKSTAEPEIRMVDVFRDGIVPPVASVLQVPENELMRVLMEKPVVVRGKPETIKRSINDCINMKLASMRALYDGLVVYLVDAINKRLHLACGNTPMIGIDSAITIYDFFGHENISTAKTANSLEQLLVNYASEVMSHSYIRTYFTKRMDVYDHEGISYVVSSLPTHEIGLNIRTVSGVNFGHNRNNEVAKDIFSSLIEHCKLYISDTDKTNNSDGLSFCTALNSSIQSPSNHSVLLPLPDRYNKSNFVVCHHSGKVNYSIVRGGQDDAFAWLLKNINYTPEMLQSLLVKSQLSLLNNRKVKVAVGYGYRDNNTNLDRDVQYLTTYVANVMNGISSDIVSKCTTTHENCHFIFCIKPNRPMRYGVFDNHYVHQQMQYLLLKQACELADRGSFVRVPCILIKSTYNDVYNAVRKEAQDISINTFIAYLLEACNIDHTYYSIGHSVVLFDINRLQVIQEFINNTIDPALMNVIADNTVTIARENKDTQIMLFNIDAKLAAQEKSLLDYGDMIERAKQELQHTIPNTLKNVNEASESIKPIVEDIKILLLSNDRDRSITFKSISDMSVSYVSNLSQIQQYHKDISINELMSGVSLSYESLVSRLSSEGDSFNSNILALITEQSRYSDAVSDIQSCITKYSKLLGLLSDAKELAAQARGNIATFRVKLCQDNILHCVDLLGTVSVDSLAVLSAIKSKFDYLMSFDAEKYGQKVRLVSSESGRNTCARLELLNKLILSIQQKISDVQYLISNPGELHREAVEGSIKPLTESVDNNTISSPLKRFSIRNMSDASAAGMNWTSGGATSNIVSGKSSSAPQSTTPVTSKPFPTTPNTEEKRVSMTKLSIKKVIAARAAAKKINGAGQVSKPFVIPNTRTDLMLDLANSMTTVALAPSTPTSNAGSPPERKNRKQSTAMKTKKNGNSPTSASNGSSNAGNFQSVSDLFDELSKMLGGNVDVATSNTVREKETILEKNDTKKAGLLRLKETLLDYIKHNN